LQSYLEDQNRAVTQNLNTFKETFLDLLSLISAHSNEAKSVNQLSYDTFIKSLVKDTSGTISPLDQMLTSLHSFFALQTNMLRDAFKYLSPPQQI
jgi:hypothetical protein